MPSAKDTPPPLPGEESPPIPAPEKSSTQDSGCGSLGMGIRVMMAIGIALWILKWNATKKPDQDSTAVETGHQLDDTKAEESSARVSDITWAELKAIYGYGSKYTDVQKKAEWPNFEGKTVEWTGTVHELTTTFGTFTLRINMGSTVGLTPDIRVWLREESEKSALKYKKGDRLTFRGQLQTWGRLTTITVKNGVIVE